MSEQTAVEVYGDLVTSHLQRLVSANVASAQEAANLIVAAQRTGHLVWAAGAGHSLGGVLEMFFRAGGLPYVNPLWHPEILPLNGAAASTAAERRTGLGAGVVAGSGVGPEDVVVVYSNSGINPYPVEIAAEARALGASVVAVTSRAASVSAPRREGRRLVDLADVVLDTAVPPGDVVWPVEEPRVAPLSSMANALCWNMVMVAASDLAPELQTWVSANTGAPDGHNERLRAHYLSRVAAL